MAVDANCVGIFGKTTFLILIFLEYFMVLFIRAESSLYTIVALTAEGLVTWLTTSLVSDRFEEDA